MKKLIIYVLVAVSFFAIVEYITITSDNFKGVIIEKHKILNQIK